MRSRMGRFTSASLVALTFLVLAAGSQSQTQYEDRVFTAHGGGQNLLSRIDPVTSLYTGTATVGAQLTDMFPHLANLNPTWLVGAAQSGGLYRLSTNQGVVDKIVNTAGPAKGAFYVNSPPLLPHYVVAEDYSGTTSKAAIEFMDVDASKVSETFVTGSLGDGFTSVCFTHTDVGNDTDPTNDYYRWWFTNLQPLGVTTDSLWVMDFNYSDTLQGDPSDPFNTNPIIPGPPFPKILTQLDSNPGKWYQVLSLASNEDMRMRCYPWKDGLSNWVVAARTHLHPGPTPFYEVHMTLCNADFAPATVPTSFEVTFDGGGAPVFKTLYIVGNYAIVTAGQNAISSGGTSVYFYYLPELGNYGLPATVDDGARGSIGLAGCDGIGVDYTKNKVYIGSDESDNLVWELTCLPAVAQFTNDSGGPGALPVSLAIIPITMLTLLEQNQPSPPNRIYPGRSTIGFRIDMNPVVTFPGQGFGNGTGKRFPCSAGSNVGSMWGLVAIAMMVGVVALFFKR